MINDESSDVLRDAAERAIAFRRAIGERLSVICWPTTDRDIDRSCDAILEAWRQCRARCG